MVKGNDVLGLPVVSFATGKKIEKIRDLVFDQTRNLVLGFLVEEGGLFSGPRIIPLSDVQTVGEDAVIVPSESSVYPVDERPDIKELLKHQVSLKGLKVLTDDGKDLGTMSDIYFDEKSGQVESYEVSGGLFADAYSGRSQVPAPQTLKIGEDVAFVPASTATLLEQQVGGLKGSVQSANTKLGEAREAASGKVQEWGQTASQKGDQLSQVTGQKVEGWKQTVSSAETRERVNGTTDRLKEEASAVWQQVKEKTVALKDQAAREVEERRIRQALGRPVSRVIFDEQDQVILNVGDLITHTAIQRARVAGSLGMLLDSVYDKEPELSKEEVKAASGARTGL